MEKYVSIDEALYHLSDSPAAVLLGKIAIVWRILKGERESKLGSRFPVLGGGRTWMPEFLSIALGSQKAARIINTFENITIINFNYDRTLEHYLYHALQELPDVSPHSAAEAIRRLNVRRPYGFVGPLNWMRWVPEPRVPFGANQADYNALKLVERIRIYMEEKHDSEIAAIREAFRVSELLIFLGFGFHDQNMKLLQVKSQSKASRRVFASVFGIDHEIHDIIAGHINPSILDYGARLFDVEAAVMLSRFRLAITMAASANRPPPTERI